MCVGEFPKGRVSESNFRTRHVNIIKGFDSALLFYQKNVDALIFLAMGRGDQKPVISMTFYKRLHLRVGEFLIEICSQGFLVKNWGSLKDLSTS